MTLTLAPTHSRLIARSIDSFLYVPPIVGLMMIFVSGLTANPEVSAEMLQAVADQTKPVQSLAPLFYTDSSGKILILAGLYCLALFLYQLYLLIWQGQTLGKKWMKIRIVRRDTGLNGGFVPNIFLRIIVNMLLGAIPFYKLLDVLFIFRKDHRCIHDMIAGTVVVNAVASGSMTPVPAQN